MLLIIPIQIIFFIIFPQPSSIEGWFALFHTNWILGLIHLDFLYLIDNVLIVFMYLAFYFSLKQKNNGLMLIALILGLLGISAYLASNKAFDMLSVSNLYYSATSDTQKNIFISAGQTMLISWQGTTFDIYYVLNGIALLNNFIRNV